MKSLTILLILLLVAFTQAGFYSQSSGVVTLDSKNFKKEVIDSDDIWLVEFYAPWCGHCQQLKPAWEKAAKALKGVVKLGAVDMDADPQAGAPYDVKGFPTLKFFGANKSSPADYQGARDEKAIVDYALKELRKVVKDRLSGKTNNSRSKGSAGSKAGSGAKATNDKDVVVLTDANFDDTVYFSKDIWLIEFYAPWCGHCKKLAPEWEEAATALKGQVKFGKVDATVEKGLGARFKVKGYPTIKYWGYGSDKTDKKAKDYQGGRTAADLKQFAQQQLASSDIEPTVHEITSSEVFKNECTSGGCIITFLPNIYESSAADRNRYLESIKKVAKSSITMPFTFFWIEAGNNIDLENNLGLGFGFPAVVAISPQKNLFGVMKGSFDEKSLNAFLTAQTPLSPLPGDFNFKKIKNWDGKDAPPLEEESFSGENVDL